MDFRRDALHQDILEMVHDFAVEDVKPLAREIDRTEEFPMANVKKMAEMGFLGIPFPENYGGSQMDFLTYIQTVEELSKYCGTTGNIVFAHTTFCSTPIYQFGAEWQKEKYLTKLCSGEWLGSFALTEPETKSGASGRYQITAVDAGSHWVLDGYKTFVSGADVADVFFVTAMTSQLQGTRGISSFIVEKGFPGLSVGKRENQVGIRAASICELVFRECIVPKENLVGSQGKGFEYAGTVLDEGRICVAAQALGIAEGALEETADYVRARKKFGRSLSQFQKTQFELAQMKTNTEAVKLLVYQAACDRDSRESFSHRAAMAKLAASQNAFDVAYHCQQLYGEPAYRKGHPIERMMRDAEITEIYGGTSEVQMRVIAGWMGIK